VAFLAELDFLAGTEPMLLGLLDTDPIADVAASNGSSARPAGTLVTQSVSLDALKEGRSRDERTVTATREVVRGGRGSLGPDRAAELVVAYHDSLHAIEHLDGAEQAATERTDVALKLLRDVLRPQQFTTIERDLRSRLNPSGRRPVCVPGSD
jgi:hypothetical protein